MRSRWLDATNMIQRWFFWRQVGGMMRPMNRPKSGAELFLVQCWVVWRSKKWGTARAGQKHVCNFGGQIALSYCVDVFYNTCFVFLCVWCRKHVLPKNSTLPKTTEESTSNTPAVVFWFYLFTTFKEKRRSPFLTVHLTTGRIKTMVCQSWNIWRTFQSA